MKKIFSIFLCAAFVFALSASLFAAGDWIKYNEFDPEEGKTVTVNIDFRPSKDVSVYYDVDPVVNYQDYIAGTKHTGGDTVYGAASDDTSIYKIQKPGYRGQTTVEGIFPNFLPPTDNESMTWEDGEWEKL